MKPWKRVRAPTSPDREKGPTRELISGPFCRFYWKENLDRSIRRRRVAVILRCSIYYPVADAKKTATWPPFDAVRQPQSEWGKVGIHSTVGKVPLEQALYPFLTGSATTNEKVKAVQTALESTDGKLWRVKLGNWAAGCARRTSGS